MKIDVLVAWIEFLKDRASALEKAHNEGVEEGIERERRTSEIKLKEERLEAEKKLKKERLETAKILLSIGLGKDKVSEITKLSIQEIDKI